MKNLFFLSTLLGLVACNWNGSASFSYSHSWKKEACRPSNIKKFEKEYKSTIDEYKRKYKDSPGELRYEEKSSEGCKSFYVGYSHKGHNKHEAEIDRKKALEEIKKKLGG